MPIADTWEISLKRLNDQMKSGSAVSIESIEDVIQRCCDAGKSWPAIDLLDTMLQMGLEPSSHTLSLILTCCCAGPTSAGTAYKIYTTLREKGAPRGRGVYIALIPALSAQGLYEELDKVWTDFTTHDTDMKPSTSMVACRIEALAATGRYPEADSLLAESIPHCKTHKVQSLYLGYLRGLLHTSRTPEAEELIR